MEFSVSFFSDAHSEGSVPARGTVGRTLSTGGHSVPLAGHNGSLSGDVIKAAGTGVDGPRGVGLSWRLG
jgi:hypothetical protein